MMKARIPPDLLYAHLEKESEKEDIGVFADEDNDEGEGDDAEIPRFVRDLELEVLLEEVPFVQELGNYALEILSDVNRNAKITQYRQDILGDLRDKNLRQDVRRFVQEVNNALDVFDDPYNMSRKAQKIGEYCKAIENPPGFARASSAGLREVGAFLQYVSDTKDFEGMAEFGKWVGKKQKKVSLESTLKNSREGTLSSEVSQLTFTLTDANGKHAEDIVKAMKNDNVPSEATRLLHGLFEKYVGELLNASSERRQEMHDLINQLDFYVGFAEYFADLESGGANVCRPTILPKEARTMKIKNATHPLLYRKDRKKQNVVPNNIAHNSTQNLFVINGPNNAGKTTHVKTIGLVQLLAQQGLWVPARSAEVSLVDGLYTHFVSPDDISKGEGRYRNELRRVKQIFKDASPYSMIIVDEPCGGTSIEEGREQSRIFLQGFHTLGAATYFVTHMHDLAREIGEDHHYPGAQNLHVEYVPGKRGLEYTFKVKPGFAQKSYGLEVARAMGLGPKDVTKMVVTRARKEKYRKLLRGDGPVKKE